MSSLCPFITETSGNHSFGWSRNSKQTGQCSQLCRFVILRWERSVTYSNSMLIVCRRRTKRSPCEMVLCLFRYLEGDSSLWILFCTEHKDRNYMDSEVFVLAKRRMNLFLSVTWMYIYHFFYTSTLIDIYLVTLEQINEITKQIYGNLFMVLLHTFT